MQPLRQDPFHVPGEHPFKAAFNPYSFSGDQRRRAAFWIVLENHLFEYAPWMREVCPVKRACRHLAVALVLQFFDNGIAPEWPKERQEENSSKAHTQRGQRHRYTPSCPGDRGLGEDLRHLRSSLFGGAFLALGCLATD